MVSDCPAMTDTFQSGIPSRSIAKIPSSDVSSFLICVERVSALFMSDEFK